jgi:hypothetical protein
MIPLILLTLLQPQAGVGLPIGRSYAALVSAVPPPVIRAVATCQVHFVPLIPTDVPVWYGHNFRLYDPEDAQLQYVALLTFPNIPHPVNAGCMKAASDPDTVVQLVCPRCQEAQRESLRRKAGP